ncbi:MAG: hypothetical protein HQM13_15010 [SAR324 cluster bacterium]|nr:hypothetical protein [SAR324 cluster bacterium]
MNKSFQKKLKDPQWEKRRIEVLENAQWRCQLCGSKKEELHVHHSYHEKGKNPWDYPDSALIALCHSCHAEKTHKPSFLSFNESRFLFAFIGENLERIAADLSIVARGRRHEDMRRHVDRYWELKKNLALFVSILGKMKEVGLIGEGETEWLNEQFSVADEGSPLRKAIVNLGQLVNYVEIEKELKDIALILNRL